MRNSFTLTRTFLKTHFKTSTCRFVTHAPKLVGTHSVNGTLCKFVVHEDLFGMILRFSPNQGIWYDLPVLIDRRVGRLFSYHLGKVSETMYSLEAFLARRTLNARSGRTGKHIRMANGLTQRSGCLFKFARFPPQTSGFDGLWPAIIFGSAIQITKTFSKNIKLTIFESNNLKTCITNRGERFRAVHTLPECWYPKSYRLSPGKGP